MSSSLDEFERLMALLDGKPAPQRAGEANLHKDAATLRAELAQLYSDNQDSGWQPIETVPDEQEVLLLWHPCGVVRQGSLYVNNGEHKFFRLVLDYGDFYSTVVTSHDDCPTHWQPLPPPPQSEV